MQSVTQNLCEVIKCKQEGLTIMKRWLYRRVIEKNMNNLKISCIVPVYNTAKYLDKCIESILKQSYKNIELILVDDGSVDDSRSICDEYKLKDERVKVFHQPNSGVSVARNVGIREASGEYICFVDSDDYIENDYFSLAIKYIEKYNPDLLINNHVKDNEKVNAKKSVVLELNNEEAIWEMFQKKHFSWEPVACFYNSNICKNIFFNKNIRYGEDLLFKYQFIKNCNHVLYASIRKYHYVFRSDSACNSYNLEKKIDDLRVLGFIIEQEENELGKMIYRREYLPRLIKYHKFGSRSNVDKERESAMHFENELLQIWKQVILDSSVSFSLKFKMIRFLVLYFISKCKRSCRGADK